jgi:hypothetical protein
MMETSGMLEEFMKGKKNEKNNLDPDIRFTHGMRDR